MKKQLLLLCVFVQLTTFLFGQCVTASQSKFPANSKNKIDSIFNFDYKIKSDVEIKTNGHVKRLRMIYYVNTQDGSMFYPKGFLLANNMKTADEHFRFDGAIWLSNRQMVTYVYDIANHIKRAMTVSSNKSSLNEFLDQHLAISSFFDDRADPTIKQEIPEPMPASFHWNGITEGFTGNIYDRNYKAKMTIYIDKHPMTIKTSFPMVGFLVGVINFHNMNKCNQLAVFTKIEQENGDYIQEELISITKGYKNFNAFGYKPIGLLKDIVSGPGSRMQNVKAKMAEFQIKSMAIANRIEKIKNEKQHCIDTTEGDRNYCIKHYNPLIKKAKEEAKKLQFDLMKKMGAEDMMKNLNKH